MLVRGCLLFLFLFIFIGLSFGSPRVAVSVEAHDNEDTTSLIFYHRDLLKTLSSTQGITLIQNETSRYDYKIVLKQTTLNIPIKTLESDIVSSCKENTYTLSLTNVSNVQLFFGDYDSMTVQGIIDRIRDISLHRRQRTITLSLTSSILLSAGIASIAIISRQYKTYPSTEVTILW